MFQAPATDPGTLDTDNGCYAEILTTAVTAGSETTVLGDVPATDPGILDNEIEVDPHAIEIGETVSIRCEL